MRAGIIDLLKTLSWALQILFFNLELFSLLATKFFLSHLTLNV